MRGHTKADKLKNWMRSMGYFASHDVIRWGLDNMYIRADRTKRDFMRQGLIRKLHDWEKSMLGFKSKDAYYKWIGKERQMRMF